MRVTVGSTNPTKIQGVEDAFHKSASFNDAEVEGVEVQTELYGHPIGLQKIIEGAMDRAKQAFHDCTFSVGLEGGMMEAPHTKSGFFEVAACAIYDGTHFAIGLSPAYEWPKVITDLIVKDGLDGSQALHKAGFTDHPKVGTAQGGISILSKGRIDRTAYNTMAVVMALVQLENKEHYEE